LSIADALFFLSMCMLLMLCCQAIKVVSTEWVAFCLRLGEWVDPDSSTTFRPPCDPRHHPLAMRREGAGGERFVVGDVVQYTSQTSTHFAKIVEFLRCAACVDEHKFDQSLPLYVMSSVE
jgi:hypothetical protein